jgi:hypothetical protein
MHSAGQVRLDRALSKLGIASRSDARKQIEAGAVEEIGAAFPGAPIRKR